MRRKFKWASAFSIIGALVFTVCIMTAAGGADETPKTISSTLDCSPPVSETLHYEFGWNGIAAANAQVQIKQTTFENAPVLRLTANAYTIGLARNLWKMDDRMEAIIHKETLAPIKVELHREEAGKTYKTDTSFSHRDGTAHVVDVEESKIKKKKVKFGNAYEPLTLILLVRCLEFKVGGKVTFDLMEGYNIYRVVLDVLGKEEIEVKAGKFEAFKITPTFYKVKKDGQIKKKDIKADEVLIWISADEKRYLLKIKSKVFIGSVYGELVKTEK